MINPVTIGVLSLQGAFAEHEKIIQNLGAICVELRCRADLDADLSGIILPGGESTVQGKLLKELDMFDRLKEMIQYGIPILATCAGLILLAESISGGESPHLATLPVSVRRNAYGRQLGSFHTEGMVKGIGNVPMTFIRAPFVESAAFGVEILSEVQGKIVAVKYINQFACSFHPELDANTKIHEAFLKDAMHYTSILHEHSKKEALCIR